MYVQITLLIEIRVDSVFGGYRTDVAYGDLRRFLHNVAERSRYLYLSVTLKGEDLDLQHRAADLGIRKTVDYADLVLLGNSLGQKLSLTEIFLDIVRFHDELLQLTVLNEALCRLSYQLGKSSLKISHSRLGGVIINYFAYRAVVDLKHLLVQTVTLELLGKQVIFRDSELLCFCIRRELDDLHSVKQRAGDGVKLICCCYKNALREVEGHLHEMVAEVLVLLSVKHLKQS